MFRCKRRFLKTFKKFEARLCRPFIQCLDFEIHDGMFINRKFFGTSDVNKNDENLLLIYVFSSMI